MTALGYVGFGLSIASDIELPEYLPSTVPDRPDIRISLDDRALSAWDASDKIPEEFIASRIGGHVMRIEDVAVFHVLNGQEIRVAVEPGADHGLLRLYVVGSAMGMALHQREVLVLHGAAVARNGEARIIVGDSGAGKSTLAALLGRAGCVVLGDDTIAVWSGPDGKGKHLWQGSRVFKLWEESLNAMGISPDELTPLGNRMRKYFVPNTGPASDGGVALVEILLLDTLDDAARIEPVRGIQAVKAIADNTYRPEYVGLLGNVDWHFRECAALAGEVQVSRLIRPWDLGRSNESLSLVLDLWKPAGVARGAG